MDLFSDIINAVQSDMTIGAESTLLTLPTVQLAINRAYRKAAGMFRWPQTEDAELTSAVANQEYYNYPQKWRPDTIWKLRVDGKDYGDRLAFKDYLYEQENNWPSGLSVAWANNGSQFFITPVPTLNGTNNIEIWGLEAVTALVNNSDTTIFSYSMPECNEAIVLEALAILRIKGGEEPVRLYRYIQGSLFLNFEAQDILTTAFEKIKQENIKNERTQPFFSVPDFFRSRRNPLRTRIGDFEDID